MEGQLLDCGCGEGEKCSALPSAFVRLHYFFGKRLGVVDFKDEQRYHSGKQRFHNMHAHGAGVLCGLLVDRFVPETVDTESTVLRVSRGAALDTCGREIIVAWDQCIDVDAWLTAERRRRREIDPGSTWPTDDVDGQRLSLCVTLRYRECNADPEPALRDPCGCDDEGCQFGRVRESFQLELTAHGQTSERPTPLRAPSLAALDAALASAGTPEQAWRAIQRALRDGCASPKEPDHLTLACFDAVLTSDLSSVEAIEDIESVDVTPTLFSTALLQELLSRIQGAGGFELTGPTIRDATFEDPGGGGDMLFRLSLSAPVLAATVDNRADLFELRELDESSGWNEPAGGFSWSPEFVDTPDPTIVIKVTNNAGFLADGKRYRLRLSTLEDAASEPVVDGHMRSLRPHGFSWSFKLVDDGGVLIAERP